MGNLPSWKVKKPEHFFNPSIFNLAYVLKCHLRYKGNSDIREIFLLTNVSLISEFDCIAINCRSMSTLSVSVSELILHSLIQSRTNHTHLSSEL